MWHRDAKGANAVGKMAPVGTGTTNLKLVKIMDSVKHNEVKYS